jgi:hypothetical protein
MTPLLLAWLLAAAPEAAPARAKTSASAPAPAATCAPGKKAKAAGDKGDAAAEGGSCAAPAPRTKAPAARAPAASGPAKADEFVARLQGAAPEDLDPNKPLPPFNWKVPGLLDWVDSDGPMMANGVPVLIQLARSSRPVEELGPYFAHQFEQAGLFIPPAGEQVPTTREPQLTALDPTRMVSYTVILQANPDKTTSVILGTANVGAWRPVRGSALLGWAPMMPGGEHLLRTDAEGQSSAAYDVDSTPDKVQAFYKDALLKAGYMALPNEEGNYRRGSELLRVRARPDEGGRTMVWLIRQAGGMDVVDAER